jgi:hypothetical protein
MHPLTLPQPGIYEYRRTRNNGRHKMNRAILAIGCGEFDHQSDSLQPLPAAPRDAGRIFEVFTNPSLGSASPDAPSKPIVNPTREELTTALQVFFEECSRKSIDPIVFFSGHAKPSSSSGWAFYCRDTDPSNVSFTTLTFRELEVIWNVSKAPRCLLVFDTCYARSANPKGIESKRTTDPDAAPPEPLNTGIVLLWSCTNLDEAYAKRDRSVFSELLETGMRIGFGADPWFKNVRAAAVATWIQNNQPNDPWLRLKPTSAELGATEGLFVSLNPRYDSSATPQIEFSSLVPEVDRDDSQMTEELKRLCSAADAYREGRQRFDERRSPSGHTLSRFLKYDSVTSSEVCVLPATARAVIFAELLLWWRLFLPMLVVIWFFIPPLIARTWKYGVALICALIAISLIRASFRNREWRNPRHHFLMVTRDGFLEQFGVWRRALTWSAVSKLDEPGFVLPFFDEYSLHLKPNCIAGKINIEGKKVKFPRTAAYGGALSVFDIHAALRWGREYERNRWQWHVFPPPVATKIAIADEQHDVNSLLIGVGVYDTLARLPAQKDIDQLRNIIGGRPLLDPSWPDLITEIDALFSRTAGRTALLYFSGHAEVKGGELYLMLRPSCVSNALTTALPVHKLLALQSERNVRDLIIILDCCYSSAAAENLDIDIKHIRGWFESLPGDIRRHVSLVAASRRDQEALASGGGSLFTGCLAIAAATACDSSGVLRLSEWYDQASKLLTAYRLEQVASYFAPCDPESVLLLRGRAERIGLISKHLLQRAVSKLEVQEKELDRIANRIEKQLKDISPGLYPLDIGGFVVRSNRPFTLGEDDDIRTRRRTALVLFYSGVIGFVLSAKLPEIYGSQSFMFRHQVALFVFAALIAFLGCLLFLGAGGTEQLYLLVVPAGVVRQWNTHRVVIPAYLITDAFTDKGMFNTPVGEPLYTSDIAVRTRNGSKETVYYEILGRPNHWPISMHDLLAKLNSSVETYLRDASAYDRESLTTAHSSSTKK